MRGKVNMLDIIAALKEAEIDRHLALRGRSIGMGQGQLGPTLPYVIPNPLHKLFDVDL
jgi:hypothetical protein